jgi:hypothetical protein
MLYARKCSICGCGMNDGYVLDAGVFYYCSDECLRRHYTEKEWDLMVDLGESYYTEWEDEFEYQYFHVQLREDAWVMICIADEPIPDFIKEFLIGDKWYIVSYSETNNECKVYLQNELVHHEKISDFI